MDRWHPTIGRGIAYIEYTTPDEAENAMKHMDGGQIDGQEITAAPVIPPKIRPMMRRPSPPMRRPPPRWRSPIRYNRRRSPPPRRRSPRRRSRSPIRRRRRSNSSDSSR